MLKEDSEDMPQGVTKISKWKNIQPRQVEEASTKVTETLIKDLQFVDDCMLTCHSEPDLQCMMTKFTNSAKNYGLQISITKTEVMYQSAPGNPYVEPIITIDNLRLSITKQFKYLGSVLSNYAQMDEDIKARISRARGAYGRLQERVLKPHCIRLHTKFQVYRATVFTTLLYGAET
jgi:hypothetical protein